MAGTSIGLFATNNLNDLSTVWTHLAPNEIGNIVVDMMDYRNADGLLAIATHGAGMFSTNISDTLFTKLDATPIMNSTLEVFPNPVQDEFVLRFELKKESDINIRIFDIRGKVVRDIRAGMFVSGKQELRIQTEDLHKGVYFIKMYDKSHIINSKKILVL